MKQYVYSLLLVLPLAATAQPVLQVVQDYKVGTTIKYRKCSPVAPGANGAGINWNFTSLTALGGMDTLTVSYLAAGSAHAGANILEKTSDSVSHYMTISGTTNHTVAYADSSAAGMNASSVFTNTALSMQRPLSFGMNVTDTFSSTLMLLSFTLANSGINTRNISVTGHGTLDLPNGSYNDVLKVRVEHKQTNTFVPYLVNLNMVSYMWFDAQHKAPLLQIDSIMVSGSPSPPVPNTTRNNTSYLIKETYPQNVNNVYGSQLDFNAFINGSSLTLEASLPANRDYRLSVTNLAGQTVYQAGFRSTTKLQQFNLGNDLPSGMYLITVHEKENISNTGTIKIVK
ncbi:MAG: hypothetical protein K0R82_866 [Flavipsychrobacter sp.]|jgi:hypothetical protein|nr:hypothetical protein [Flavipsychrobacter sp.]